MSGSTPNRNRRRTGNGSKGTISSESTEDAVADNMRLVMTTANKIKIPGSSLTTTVGSAWRIFLEGLRFDFDTSNLRKSKIGVGGASTRAANRVEKEVYRKDLIKTCEAFTTNINVMNEIMALFRNSLAHLDRPSSTPVPEEVKTNVRDFQKTFQLISDLQGEAKKLFKPLCASLGVDSSEILTQALTYAALAAAPNTSHITTVTHVAVAVDQPNELVVVEGPTFDDNDGVSDSDDLTTVESSLSVYSLGLDDNGGGAAPGGGATQVSAHFIASLTDVLSVVDPDDLDDLVTVVDFLNLPNPHGPFPHGGLICCENTDVSDTVMLGTDSNEGAEGDDVFPSPDNYDLD